MTDSYSPLTGASDESEGNNQEVVSEAQMESAEPLNVEGNPEPDMSIFESEEKGEDKSEPKFTIDEKFKDLPEHEGIIRTLQSQKDKYANQLDIISRDLEGKEKYENFYTSIMEDDSFLNAFLAERKPELISGKDITNDIQTKLKEEFGDFKPTRSEADDDPGGKAWLYYKRLDELYSELKSSKESYTSLKELAEKRKLAKKMEAEELAKSEREVKNAMKWNDDQFGTFLKWARGLNLSTLAKMYRYALRTNRVTSVNQIQGSPTGVSERSKFLNTLK